MKKTISILCALLMAFSFSVISFADTEPEDIACNDVANAVSDIVTYADGIVVDDNVFKTIEDAAIDALTVISKIDFTQFNSDIIASTIDTFKDAFDTIGISPDNGPLNTLFNELKLKIKNLYCGSETVITEYEDAPDTGSTSTGIIAFYIMSTAAALAYISKKKFV